MVSKESTEGFSFFMYPNCFSAVMDIFLFSQMLEMLSVRCNRCPRRSKALPFFFENPSLENKVTLDAKIYMFVTS